MFSNGARLQATSTVLAPEIDERTWQDDVNRARSERGHVHKTAAVFGIGRLQGVFGNLARLAKIGDEFVGPQHGLLWRRLGLRRRLGLIVLGLIGKLDVFGLQDFDIVITLSFRRCFLLLLTRVHRDMHTSSLENLSVVFGLPFVVVGIV